MHLKTSGFLPIVFAPRIFLKVWSLKVLKLTKQRYNQPKTLIFQYRCNISKQVIKVYSFNCPNMVPLLLSKYLGSLEIWYGSSQKYVSTIRIYISPTLTLLSELLRNGLLYTCTYIQEWESFWIIFLNKKNGKKYPVPKMGL